MQDLNTLDINLIGEWFVDDSEIWIPPSKEIFGKRKILILFRAIFKRYSTLEWSVQNIFTLDENKFMYQTKSSGIMSDGRDYQNEICTIIHFSTSGKITFLSDYFKNTEIFN
ncbi:hypothetical protein ASG01_12335 [Chryseobacterium sp. Leaf180]|uniref:nuclear transport factor 2 family protein n=1 Tax=Chryseobacterium sp. Leaf180 TaxID=1736289 RepID=UPI0006F9FB54|nr:hypothetical protein [Chryseobacterium sp. Leaf180]KQR92675.1 hypothetical protein ASG01_12335 [Chryseobacterium sp. Leaf180]